MDALVTVLLVLGALMIVLLASLPLSLIAIWRYSKSRRHRHLKAILFGLLNGLIWGLGLAATGFLFGAAVPDESAGVVALYLAGFGLLAGGVGSFLASIAVIEIGCAIVTKRSTAT